MQAWDDFEKSRRQVRRLAYRVMRRLSSINAPIISQSDIEQELWVGWCKARDVFDPERGVPFAAFAQRGMKQHINRYIERHIERFEGQTFALSLDANCFENGEDTTLGEAIASDNPEPHKISEQLSSFRASYRRMSPKAQTFVRILNDQPQELLQEILMAQDKAEHASKLGAPYVQQRRITSKMVFDLMGLSRTERVKIMAEVESIAERASR